MISLRWSTQSQPAPLHDKGHLWRSCWSCLSEVRQVPKSSKNDQNLSDSSWGCFNISWTGAWVAMIDISLIRATLTGWPRAILVRCQPNRMASPALQNQQSPVLKRNLVKKGHPDDLAWSIWQTFKLNWLPILTRRQNGGTGACVIFCWRFLSSCAAVHVAWFPHILQSVGISCAKPGAVLSVGTHMSKHIYSGLFFGWLQHCFYGLGTPQQCTPKVSGWPGLLQVSHSVGTDSSPPLALDAGFLGLVFAFPDDFGPLGLVGLALALAVFDLPSDEPALPLLDSEAVPPFICLNWYRCQGIGLGWVCDLHSLLSQT